MFHNDIIHNKAKWNVIYLFLTIPLCLISQNIFLYHTFSTLPVIHVALFVIRDSSQLQVFTTYHLINTFSTKLVSLV